MGWVWRVKREKAPGSRLAFSLRGATLCPTGGCLQWGTQPPSLPVLGLQPARPTGSPCARIWGYSCWLPACPGVLCAPAGVLWGSCAFWGCKRILSTAINTYTDSPARTDVPFPTQRDTHVHTRTLLTHGAHAGTHPRVHQHAHTHTARRLGTHRATSARRDTGAGQRPEAPTGGAGAAQKKHRGPQRTRDPRTGGCCAAPTSTCGVSCACLFWGGKNKPVQSPAPLLCQPNLHSPPGLTHRWAEGCTQRCSPWGCGSGLGSKGDVAKQAASPATRKSQSSGI